MIRLLINEIASEKDVLVEYNANITYICLPCKIRGFIYSYRNINNIFINRNLSLITKKKTILHELAHIELNHIYKLKECLNFNLDNTEDEVDKYIYKLIE